MPAHSTTAAFTVPCLSYDRIWYAVAYAETLSGARSGPSNQASVLMRAVP